MSASFRRPFFAPTFLLSLALAVLIGTHCAPREATSSDSGRAAAERSALGWATAIAPVRIRSGHTSTLTGTGEVLVAGGGATPRSTEIIDPLGSKISLGPELVDERSFHTATMLLSGKVLIAGGTGKASAELYDPRTRTSVPTGAMSRPRAHHLAIRLRSGRVLVMGGAGVNQYVPDSTNELYDPQTGTWSTAPARQSLFARAAATLQSGKVLVSSRGESAEVTTELYDPSADSQAPWTTVASALPAGVGTRSLTRLFDGRVLSIATGSCATSGGPIICDTHASIFNPAGPGTTTAGPNLAGRDLFSAVRTIDGRVLVVGGTPDVSAASFDPSAPGAFADDGALESPHIGTATLLPGGDVLVVGGDQATIDRRIAAGRWVSLPGLELPISRARHAAVRLHDGRLLVTGGEEFADPPTGLAGDEAEIIDPVTGTLTPASRMITARKEHTMTALRSGKVLVAGGHTAAAELFDPGASAASFSPAGPMSVARAGHTATLLPSGKVLVVGGDAEGTAELFDPAANAFAPLPKPAVKWVNHGAVLMPNGLVLIVGGGAAEMFDPVTSTFRVTTPPGASRDGRTAHLLGSGKVIVFGGVARAAEMFDPVTETWSFTATLANQFPDARWTGLPDGRLVSSGGTVGIFGLTTASFLFDPLAQPVGGSLQVPTPLSGVYFHTATLAGTGDVVITGGEGCHGNCFHFTINAIRVYRDGAPLAQRPTISEVPANVVGGTTVTITGTGFANGPEASDGQRSASAVNHPLVHWVSDAGDAVVGGTVLDFTDTTATWLVPATALHGHGQLFVSVAGIMSLGRPVAIGPAEDATGCTYDAQCGSGFCVDGVCCDRRCDDSCEGCSALRKTTGDDGVCGPVPPGRDIAGRCVLKLGDACSTKEECGPNFCSPQGVCCDSACEGQCLSCALEGKAGRCSAINEGACGAACDGDHTLKQVGVPDVDCAPYTCDGPSCNTTCASVRDCVAPAVCSLEGQCVPPRSPSPSDDSVCGCRAVGAHPSGSSGAPAVSLVVLLVVGRLRRRGERG